jgi:uncharacterized protein (DUF488 family)
VPKPVEATRSGPTVYTIGHGNRPLDELIAMLKEAGIERLVDVRAFPASRRHPHFGRAALEQSLPAAGIRYVWEGEALGGRRKPRADSPHVALRHPAFRAYADHMMTPEFHGAVERLLQTARAAPAAVMCAERLPWQCHRFLISDFLVAGGNEVIHLVNPGKRQSHRLNPIARIREGELVYDGRTQGELELPRA